MGWPARSPSPASTTAANEGPAVTAGPSLRRPHPPAGRFARSGCLPYGPGVSIGDVWLRLEMTTRHAVTDVAFLFGYRDYERRCWQLAWELSGIRPNRGPIGVSQIGVGAMPRSAQHHDHQAGDAARRRPRHA